jgi:hypothetical protein
MYRIRDFGRFSALCGERIGRYGGVREDEFPYVRSSERLNPWRRGEEVMMRDALTTNVALAVRKEGTQQAA